MKQLSRAIKELYSFGFGLTHGFVSRSVSDKIRGSKNKRDLLTRLRDLALDELKK